MANARSRTIRHRIDETHVIDISVSFQAGGINYSTYKTEPKGYVVAVRPKEITDDGCERYMMFDDRAGKITLELADRFNAKRLDVLVKQTAPRIAAALPDLIAGRVYEGLVILQTGAPLSAVVPGLEAVRVEVPTL